MASRLGRSCEVRKLVVDLANTNGIGHDTMMKWEPIALLVMKAFNL